MDIDQLLSNLHRYPESVQEMVEKQIISRGVQSESVIQAFLEVDRKIFVPAKAHAVAYADQPVPIGFSQTISQPYIVAFMTEKLEVSQDSKVLEIGSGCGYQTAILAKLACKVFSIEVIPELVALAQKNLQQAHIENFEIFNQNGRSGLKEQAPFDRILVTAGSRDIPKKLINQLADRGKMIIPVGKYFDHQELLLITKENNKVRTKPILPVRFVPLV
ncbi:MAG: protein-L-isoaspartate(D-aspartate) O-methyltransferase [Candidatus Marinimicrobia bacterium]|nr:protein-L-isoaspartate(D-aspartate) O-methyltransferase [Candidatus Neomarinimicrobiota bacterium]